MAHPSSHAAASNYASVGFSSRMNWGTKPALLLIDVSVAYWTPGSPLDISSNPDYPEAAAAPDSMRRLLAAARKGGVPVIWTTVKYETMDEAGLFYNKAKMLDVWMDSDERKLGAWVEGLVPIDGEEIVVKKYPSAFFETGFKERLGAMGVDTVVICGVSTSGCVRASALDAMCSGFRPMVSFAKQSKHLEVIVLTCHSLLLRLVVIDRKRFKRRICLI